MVLETSLTARCTGFMTILIIVMSMRCWPISFTSRASSAQVWRVGLEEVSEEGEKRGTYLYESVAELPEVSLVAYAWVLELHLFQTA